MSLPATMARLAPKVMNALAPMTATFTRTTVGDYDAISNTEGPSTSASWTGTAVWAKNDQAGTRSTTALSQGTGMVARSRTLLVSGIGLQAPVAGDAVTVSAVLYRVGDVTNVGDADGSVVPLYRVECVA